MRLHEKRLCKPEVNYPDPFYWLQRKVSLTQDLRNLDKLLILRSIQQITSAPIVLCGLKRV